MKSIPILDRLIPPFLMIVNLIQVFFCLVFGGVMLILTVREMVAGKSPGFLAFIALYSLTLSVPTVLLICFYYQMARSKLAFKNLRFGWMVSCIYHATVLWQDVFINHGQNRFPLGSMDVPLWTLSALAFVASLYAFLLLLEEHPQAGIRNPFLSRT